MTDRTHSRGSAPTRRRLVAVADGVILVFDVILVAFVATGLLGLVAGGVGNQLYDLTIGSAHGWMTTPGVGAVELVAYVGLAAVLLGPVWHRYRERSDEPAGGSGEFVFSAGSASTGTPSPPRVPRPEEYPRPTGYADWVADLLVTEPAPDGGTTGDVNRGGWSANGRVTETDGEPLPSLSSVEAVERQLEATVSATAESPASGASETPGEKTRTTAGQSADGPQGPPGTDGSRRSEDAGDGRTGSETDGASTGPASRSETTGREPVDRLTEEVAASRMRLDVAAERLREASAGRGGDRSASAITSLIASAEATLAPLHSHEPSDGVGLRSAVRDSKQRQRSIEAGFEAALAA